MSHKHHKPAQAKELLDSKEGWVCLDVRSVEEFALGHATGAFNIPIMHRGPSGMSPNPDFTAVVTKCFPKDAKLVVGCASGMRSVRACEALASAGYKHLVNMEGGFMGGQDEAGRAIPGWASCGLPVEKTAPPERTYAGLRQKA